MLLRPPAKLNVKRNIPDDPEEFRLTLLEHLEDLRSRIVRSVIFISVAWIIGWYLQPWLYEQLNATVSRAVLATIPKTTEYQEAFTNVTQAFMLKFRLSFMIGLSLAFPFILLEVWGFIAPGLKAAERKPLQKLAPLSLLLFFIGVGFCWIIVPATFSWFASYLQEFTRTVLYQEPGAMIFFVVKLMLAFGLGFQLPLIVYFLGRIGILEPETLVQYWRQATVVIFFLSAIFTPSNDIFTMLMMAVPLTILFMISVWAVRLTNRGKRGNPVEELNHLDPVEEDEPLALEQSVGSGK